MSSALLSLMQYSRYDLIAIQGQQNSAFLGPEAHPSVQTNSTGFLQDTSQGWVIESESPSPVKNLGLRKVKRLNQACNLVVLLVDTFCFAH
jgi:hypothetical protein